MLIPRLLLGMRSRVTTRVGPHKLDAISLLTDATFTFELEIGFVLKVAVLVVVVGVVVIGEGVESAWLLKTAVLFSGTDMG